MTDSRPIHSTMPDHLQAIYTKHGDAVLDHLRDAFDEAMKAEGDPAHLKNDGLSLMSQIAASASLLFIAKLVELHRHRPAADFWAIRLTDIQERMAVACEQFGEFATATRQ